MAEIPDDIDSSTCTNAEQRGTKRRRNSTQPGPSQVVDLPIREARPSMDAPTASGSRSLQNNSRPQPNDEAIDAPIPSYEQSVSENSSRNNQLAADMLLAMQLAMMDSEDGEIDLANLHHFPMHEPMEAVTAAQPPDEAIVDDETSANNPTRNYEEYNIDDDDELLQALLAEEIRGDTTQALRNTMRTTPRDRYDIAGIDTFRVDPRRTNSLYSKYRLKSNNIPVTSGDGWRSTWGTNSTITRPRPLIPNTILEGGTIGLPVLNPESGAPLVNISNVDVFLCMLDFLTFPDLFALALTCKALHNAIDLTARKEQYRKALLLIGKLCHGNEARNDESGGRGLCDVCLYELPASYFKPRAGKRARMEISICSDCSEFRDRVEASMASEDSGGDYSKSKNDIWVVWRPSQRVVVEGTDGFLWYRRRA